MTVYIFRGYMYFETTVRLRDCGLRKYVSSAKSHTMTH
jgi:hypothetical protein